MKNINEEISRIKKLIIYELSEKEDSFSVESPVEGDIETVDTEILPTSNVDGFTYGACEVQDFLIKKGYLTKKDKDCDFGDITAAALGKYVGDKLGIDLGIYSVSDLQKYMEKLGLDTGSSGYGKLMAEKVSELINYLENIVNSIINSPYFWSMVKKYINSFSSKLIGKQINKDSDVYSKEITLLPDLKIEYPMTIKSIKIDKLNKNTVSLVGTIDMKVLLTYGYYDTLDYTNVNFDLYMSWGFVEKVVDGKNCICLRFKVWDGTLNSSGVGFDKTYWTLSITDNVPNIDFGTVFGYDIGDVDLDAIDFVGEMKKQKLTFCIKYEDIIKLLVGEITMDKIKISNL